MRAAGRAAGPPPPPLAARYPARGLAEPNGELCGRKEAAGATQLAHNGGRRRRRNWAAKWPAAKWNFAPADAQSIGGRVGAICCATQWRRLTIVRAANWPCKQIVKLGAIFSWPPV